MSELVAKDYKDETVGERNDFRKRQSGSHFKGTISMNFDAITILPSIKQLNE